MTVKIEHEVIQSGQLAAFKDTTHVVRVRFSQLLHGQEDFVPWPIERKAVQAILPHLSIGYTSYIYRFNHRAADPLKDYYRTRLVYLKEIQPGLWEFKTLSRYTD